MTDFLKRVARRPAKPLPAPAPPKPASRPKPKGKPLPATASTRKMRKAQEEAARRMLALGVKQARTNAELTDEERAAARALNPQQLLFCNLQLAGLANATHACAEAFGHDLSKPSGYNTAKSAASQLMKREDIRRYMDLMKQASALAAIYGRQWALHVLVEIVERSMELRPLTYFGQEVEGHLAFDGRTAIAAVREINAMMGHHAPTETRTSGEINHHFHRAREETDSRIEEILGD